jgi:phosphate starvation-inducible PhoH-like protein
VRPQSDGQRQLMAAIERHHLTIALGPAGTGKTYLAVSAAAGVSARGASVVSDRAAAAHRGLPG